MTTPPPAPPSAPASTSAGARLGGLSGLTVAFVIGMLLLVWLAVILALRAQRNDTLDAANSQNLNLARALEEQTLRVLSATDQATIRVRDAVLASRDQLPPLVAVANETGLAPKILVQLAVVDAQGRLRASNLDPDGSKSAHVDLSEREHVRVHLSPINLPPDIPPLSSNGLFIGKPVLGKVSKRWTIQISRVIKASSGEVLGVVVASLDPGYFEDVFRRVGLGPQGGVSLVGSDRTIRARVIGNASAGMGSQISSSSPLVAAGAAPEGHYEAVSGVDGVTRLAAYRRVADYPVFVLVATGTDESLASWRYNRNLTLALVGLLSLAVIGAATGFVTGLRRLERTNAALQISEAQAQAANQAKSEFLAAISHELRTPLTSIRGFAELLERRLENPKFQEAAGLIRKGAEDLNRLVSEILDLAKAEAGAMVLAPATVDLRPLLDDVSETFALPARNKGLQFELTLADDLPAQVVADPLRLKQILTNLLSNALKFTVQGSITLQARREGERIVFAVADTGPGIPPEAQALVFEKFRQGDARVSYEHGGTGLGLALSRGLAELMGGTLSLQSTVGQGSCFTLSMPLQVPVAA